LFGTSLHLNAQHTDLFLGRHIQDQRYNIINVSEVIITASKIASISDSDSTAGSRWDELVRKGQSTMFEMSKQITKDADGSEGKR
jgi:hypothetical protein